jgi:hypothetical protein
MLRISGNSLSICTTTTTQAGCQCWTPVQGDIIQQEGRHKAGQHKPVGPVAMLAASNEHQHNKSRPSKAGERGTPEKTTSHTRNCSSAHAACVGTHPLRVEEVVGAGGHDDLGLLFDGEVLPGELGVDVVLVQLQDL